MTRLPTGVTATEWQGLIVAATPVALAIIGLVQLMINRKLKRQSDEQQNTQHSVERIENMAERNTRKLHGEGEGE